jgi:Flp pilus assembly protein TadG
MKMRPRPWRDERGAAALEFALIVPILILLLIGTITSAMVYGDHVALNNAAREGARYGAAADITSSDWATSVRDRVKQTYFNSNGAQPSNSNICVKLVSASGTTLASYSGADCGSQPTVPTSMNVGSCAVLVWMEMPDTIELAVAPTLHPQLHAESVAYYQQSVVNTACTAN